VKQKLAHEYGVAIPSSCAHGRAAWPSLVDGNRVETLLNGDQIFPAMLAAIRAAKKTITFETYIYWSGDIGQNSPTRLPSAPGRRQGAHPGSTGSAARRWTRRC
jgi:phosphatidylserine/phosphatidylglycerophosphate/cardiolipin synthase-like enzyme